ncbi:MAG: hypothetical protein NW215_09980 [Hyphomicrobiales bacterium]|nr:hypothetical protein [Hyphomicrobiales bacterium]
MIPQRHVSPEILMSFSAGALSSATAAIVAAHLDWCPVCRARLARLDILGGLMLERAPSAPVNVEAALAKWASAGAGSGLVHHPRGSGTPLERHLPTPLAAQTGFERASIPWRPVNDGVHLAEARLPGDGGLRFVKLDAGKTLPFGERVEAALVLWGELARGRETLLSGDFADGDDLAQGGPVALAAGCTLVLSVSASPSALG